MSDNEARVILAVIEYVKINKVRVPNPDYLYTKMYSAQWKIRGTTYYYQLPNKGKIIAIIDKQKGIFKFSADGLSLD